MKKFLALLAVLAVLAVLVSPVFSQEKADKDKEKRYSDIKRMLDATQATKMIDQMKAGMKGNMGKLFHDMVKDKDLEMTDEVKKLYDEHMAKSYDSGMKIINIEEMMNDMIPSYDKYMSNEDVLAIIAFYESPAGKRMIEAAPKIMMEYMPKMMDKMKSGMEKVKKESEANSKEFAEKIKAIKEKQKKEKESKEKK